MTETLDRLNAAMREWVKPFMRGMARDFDLTPEMVALIQKTRTDIRVEQGGGGMCHVVSEWLEADYGLTRLSVTYLAPNGEVAFSAHLVNLLKDGSILDSTADQIGEGHDVRLLRPDDPEYGRYRPEFYEDYHPGHPDVEPGSLDAWSDLWTGTVDYVQEDQIRAERGTGWWLEDKTSLVAYWRDQIQLARGTGRLSDDGYADYMLARVADLESRVANAPSP